MPLQFKSNAGTVTKVKKVAWKDAGGTVANIAKVLWKDAAGAVIQLWRSIFANVEEVWNTSSISYARSVAVDSAGNVYCAYMRTSGDTLRKYNSAGGLQWSDNLYTNAWGVAIGSVTLFCSYYDSTVYLRQLQLSNAGETWKLTGNENASDISVGASYVYCMINNSSGVSLRKISRTTGATNAENSSVPYGSAIAIDSNENLYCGHEVVAGSKSVRKLTASLSEVWSKTEYGKCYGIAVDGDGNVYCSAGGIRKLNNAGVVIWTNTDITGESRVSVGDDGCVYCASYVASGKTLRKLDPNGNEVWSRTDVSYGFKMIPTGDNDEYLYSTHDSGSKILVKWRQY